MPPEANQVGSGLPRRSVLRAAALGSAAWVAPAVAIANAAPAVAASAPQLPPGTDIQIYYVGRQSQGADDLVWVKTDFGLTVLYDWVGSVTAVFTMEATDGSTIMETTTVAGPTESIWTSFEGVPPGEYTVSSKVTVTLTSYDYNGVKYEGSWILESETAVGSMTV